MKHYFRLILLMGLLLSLSLALPLAAQEEPGMVGQALGLGDEVTGTLEQGERSSFSLDLEDIDQPIDVVLFSTDDSVLYVYDERGISIQTVDRIGANGNEVFTWESGDRIPAHIELSFYEEDPTLGYPALEYSLSILPIEQQVSEEPIPGEQVKRWAEVEVGEGERARMVTVPYLLYLPEDYDENQQYPFILFLHGAGEAGTRLDFLKSQVMPKLIEEGQDYPFIIASPQLGYQQDWGNKVFALASFVEHLQAEFPIDSDRIYVTGLSLGGQGAWLFALAYPDLPAAVVPMAGFYIYGSNSVPRNICDLAEIPMWVFHGEQDEVVDLAWEQALVDAARECGGDVQFTLYPDADHEQTFVRGYADPALYEWLLEQHS